jgi:anti-sigma regulatory factor (Ser/Thr protein kinase)
VDSGQGIADIEQAMQPGFSTATEDVRALGFGAGMGLPNMKKYTDDFAIESTLGVGTKITLTVKF